MCSHWAKPGQRRKQGPGQDQWGTIGLGICPISNVMWKLLHSYVQAICFCCCCFLYFGGATDAPVFDLWWCLPWVSKLWWIPSLKCFIAYMQQICQIHRWCDLLAASLVVRNFDLHTCIQALVELDSSIEHAPASDLVTRQTLCRLS